VSAPNTVEFDLPIDCNLAPPGWYLLFAVDTAGIPSVAAWLHLT
jgi:Domain of unknown function (DUF1929)